MINNAEGIDKIKLKKPCYYSYICDATINSPVSGIKRIHKISKRYRIPVTWVVNLRTSQLLKEILKDYVAEGDSIIFKLQSPNYIYDNPGMELAHLNLHTLDSIEKYSSLIHEQIKGIKEVFGDIKINTAVLSIRNPFFIEALIKEGFDAVWGLNPNENYEDPTIKHLSSAVKNKKLINFIEKYHNKMNKIGEIFDSGFAPSGSYITTSKGEPDLSSEEYNIKCYEMPRISQSAPYDNQANSQLSKNIIFLELCSRDILRSYYSKKPTLFSLLSLEAQKSRLITGQNISYWKKIVDDHILNAYFNTNLKSGSANSNSIPYLINQFQAANEVEMTMANNSVRIPKEIEEFEIILDKFFSLIRDYKEKGLLTPVVISNYVEDVKRATKLNNFMDSTNSSRSSSSNSRGPVLVKYYYVRDKLVKNIEYYKNIFKAVERRKYYYKRLKYLIRRIFGVIRYEDIPEQFPRFNWVYPPLFVFQNRFTKAYFKLYKFGRTPKYMADNKENRRNSLFNGRIIIPDRVYNYTQYPAMKINPSKYPKIKSLDFGDTNLNEDLAKDLSEMSEEYRGHLNLEIFSSRDMPFPIIILNKRSSMKEYNTIKVKINPISIPNYNSTKNSPTIEEMQNDSFISPDFIFLFLYLKKGLNKLNINFEKI
ncbi:MAG: hypothetical protein ACTSU2_08600 [Promethearchaeota archaeon]